MKNYILIIIYFSAFNNNLFSQFFVTEGNHTGIDFSQNQVELELKSAELVESLPLEYQDSFKIIAYEYYLDDTLKAEGINNILSLINSNVQSTSKYYLLIGRISDSKYFNSRALIKLYLPGTHSLSPCFTDEYKYSLENSLQIKFNEFNYKNNNDEYFKAEITIIERAKDLIEHVINCCGRSNENCSICFYDQELANSSLLSNGYFNLNNLLENLLGIHLTVQINSKSYSHIESSYEIIFKSEDNQINYNYTDQLEDYKEQYTNNGDFEATVNIFDNDISTNEVDCYSPEFLSQRSARTNAKFIENIVINNNNNTPEIYVKDIFIELISKIPVYLYNNSDKTNSLMWPKMQSSYNDAENIYQKNGLDILEYHLLESETAYNNLILKDRDLFYNFTYRPAGINCPIGDTEFATGDGLKMEKTLQCHWSCFIDVEKFTTEYSRGWALAHEILHALTIKGSRLINMPPGRHPSSLENWACCPGGHFDIFDKKGNYIVNLLLSGHALEKCGNYPKRNYNVLDARETIVPEEMFFALKAIFIKND